MLRFGAQLGQERPSEPAPACFRVHVHGVLADALVDAAVGVGAGAGPADHLIVVDGDDERLTVLEPSADVLGRAWAGLERRDAFGDPGVLDLDRAIEVFGLGRTDPDLAELRHRDG